MAKNLPYPPSRASEAMSCYEGILPSVRDASGNAFLLYCRAVSTNATPVFKLATLRNLLNYTLIRYLKNSYRDNAFALMISIKIDLKRL
jgi:hypothetical protein